MTFTKFSLQGTFEEFVSFFEEGLILYGSYLDHIKSAWAYSNHENMSIIWYEEMKENQKLVIETLCKFLGCDLSEEKVNQLVGHLGFDNMKKNKAANMADVMVQGDFLSQWKWVH